MDMSVGRCMFALPTEDPSPFFSTEKGVCSVALQGAMWATITWKMRMVLRVCANVVVYILFVI